MSDTMTADAVGPSVLFVPIHNTGRGQRTAGARPTGGEHLVVRCAGCDPAPTVDPVAVAVMAYVGIEVAGQAPTRLDHHTGPTITMGCGDACPVRPGKPCGDRQLDDPAGQAIDMVRPTRDDIHDRLRALVAELSPERAVR